MPPFSLPVKSHRIASSYGLLATGASLDAAGLRGPIGSSGGGGGGSPAAAVASSSHHAAAGALLLSSGASDDIGGRGGGGPSLASDPILPIEDCDEATWLYAQTQRRPKTALEAAAARVGAFKPLTSWKRRVLRLTVKDGSSLMTLSEDEDATRLDGSTMAFALGRIVDLRWLLVPEEESLVFATTAPPPEDEEGAAQSRRRHAKGGGGGGPSASDGDGGGSSNPFLLGGGSGPSTASFFDGGPSRAAAYADPLRYEYVYGQIAFTVFLLRPAHARRYDAACGVSGDGGAAIAAVLADPDACDAVSFAFGSTAEAESWHAWFSEFILLRERAAVESKDAEDYLLTMSGGGGGGGGGGSATHSSSISGVALPPPSFHLTAPNLRALKDYVSFFLKAPPKGVGGSLAALAGFGGGVNSSGWGPPPNGGRLRCRVPASAGAGDEFYAVVLSGNRQTSELFFARGGGSKRSLLKRLAASFAGGGGGGDDGDDEDGHGRRGGGGTRHHSRRLILTPQCRIMATSAFGTEFVIDMTPLPNAIVYDDDGHHEGVVGDIGRIDHFHRIAASASASHRRGSNTMWAVGADGASHYSDAGGGARRSASVEGADADETFDSAAAPSPYPIDSDRRRGSEASANSSSALPPPHGAASSSFGGPYRISSSAFFNTTAASTMSLQPRVRTSRNTWTFVCKTVKIRNAFIEWLRALKAKGLSNHNGAAGGGAASADRLQTEEETYPFTVSARAGIEEAYHTAAVAAAAAAGGYSSPSGGGASLWGGGDDGTATVGFWGAPSSDAADGGQHHNEKDSFGGTKGRGAATADGQKGGGYGGGGRKVGFNTNVVATDEAEERRRREEAELLALYPATSSEPSSCSSDGGGGRGEPLAFRSGDNGAEWGSGGRPFRPFATHFETVVLPYIDAQAAAHLVGRPLPILRKIFPPGAVPPQFLSLRGPIVGIHNGTLPAGGVAGLGGAGGGGAALNRRGGGSGGGGSPLGRRGVGGSSPHRRADGAEAVAPTTTFAEGLTPLGRLRQQQEARAIAAMRKNGGGAVDPAMFAASAAAYGGPHRPLTPSSANRRSGELSPRHAATSPQSTRYSATAGHGSTRTASSGRRSPRASVGASSSFYLGGGGSGAASRAGPPTPRSGAPPSRTPLHSQHHSHDAIAEPIHQQRMPRYLTPTRASMSASFATPPHRNVGGGTQKSGGAASAAMVVDAGNRRRYAPAIGSAPLPASGLFSQHTAALVASAARHEQNSHSSHAAAAGAAAFEGGLTRRGQTLASAFGSELAPLTAAAAVNAHHSRAAHAGMYASYSLSAQQPQQQQQRPPHQMYAQ